MKKSSLTLKLINAPYMIWAVLFILAPLIMVIYYAFTDRSGAFTLDNIKALSSYGAIFGRSAWYAVLATVICLILAYPLAYIMAKSRANTQRTIMMLIMLPMWMNFLIRTYSWITILSNTGLINSLLKAVGLPTAQLINTPGAVILGMVYNFLPYMVLPIYSVMSKLDKSLVEAAQDLGAGKLQVLKKVIFPLSLPGVVSGITMVFVPSVSTFYISQKLGGGKFLLIGDSIEMQFQSAYNYNLGASLSLVLMLLIIVCMLIMNRFADNEEGPYCSRRGGDDNMKALKKIYIALIMLFLYAPMLVMVVFSFNASNSTSVMSGFSLKWYVEMFRNATALTALRNTLVLAVTSALISIIIGTAAAVGINAMKKRWLRSAVMTVTNVPMMNPEIVTGVSMMLLFVFAGKIVSSSSVLGFPTLLIAHVTFNLPYVILSVLPKLRQTDRHLSEAAQDLGCTPTSAFFKVVLPNIKSGIITGFIMAFTLSLDDFIISYFVSGAKFQTLPIVIFSMTKKKVKPDMYALSTLIFVSVLVLMILMNVLQARSEKKERKRAKGSEG